MEENTHEEMMRLIQEYCAEQDKFEFYGISRSGEIARQKLLEITHLAKIRRSEILDKLKYYKEENNGERGRRAEATAHALALSGRTSS